MLQIVLFLLAIAIGVWVVGKLGGNKDVSDAGEKASKKLGGCVLQIILATAIVIIVYLIVMGAIASGS